MAPQSPHTNTALATPDLERPARRDPGWGRAAGIARRLTHDGAGVEQLAWREATRALALGRLSIAATTVIAASTARDVNAAIWVLVSVGLAWQIATNVPLLRAAVLPFPLVVCSVVDGVILAAAYPLAGGADARLGVVLAVIPPLLAFAYSARTTVAVSMIPFTGFAATAIVEVADGRSGALRALLLVTAAFAAGVVLAVLAVQTRERAAARTAELYALRRGLLAQALAAEERASRRVSESLHDNALQTLLAATQDLGELEPRDDEQRRTLHHARSNLAQGIADLRRTVRELHPITLSRGGLAGAVAYLIGEHAQRSGFEAVVDIEDDACGRNDELVFSLVRELVNNAAKHACADQVVVRLEADDHWLHLAVIDDGVGMTEERAEEAVAAGHIGLASTRERVEAAGGRMTLESSGGAGTAVRVRLPL